LHLAFLLLNLTLDVRNNFDRYLFEDADTVAWVCHLMVGTAKNWNIIIFIIVLFLSSADTPAQAPDPASASGYGTHPSHKYADCHHNAPSANIHPSYSSLVIDNACSNNITRNHSLLK